MKKTGKYKKHGNIRKTRKHNSKLIGGYCCKYEDGVECNYGILSDPTDITNKSKITKIPLLLTLNDGHELKVYYQNHTFKHMEDMGLTCYNTNNLNSFLTNYIPKMHIFNDKPWNEQLDTTKEEIILYDSSTIWGNSIINENFFTNIFPKLPDNNTYFGFANKNLYEPTNIDGEYFCILFQKYKKPNTHNTHNTIVVYAIYLHKIEFHKETGYVKENKRIYKNKYNDIYSQNLNQIDENFNKFFNEKYPNINDYIQKIENAVTNAPGIIINSQRKSESISTDARNHEILYRYKYRGAINKKIDRSIIKKIDSSISHIDACNEFINKHSKRVMNARLSSSLKVIENANKFVIRLKHNLKKALKIEIDKVINPYKSKHLTEEYKTKLNENRSKINNLLKQPNTYLSYLSQPQHNVSTQEEKLKNKYDEIKYDLDYISNITTDMEDKFEEMKSKITDSISNPSSFVSQSHTGV